MRVSSAPLRRLRASPAGTATRLWNVLNARSRWPRWTTRRLMVLVAVVALLIWAIREVPRMIDRTMLCQGHADAQAASEREYRDKARESRARARAIRAEFDQLRRDAGSADQLTERYFASRRESESRNVEYDEYMASYYESEKRKFLRARWFPWQSLPPPTVPPRDPFEPPQLERHQVYELIEGGISVAFSPKGQALAVGCRDETIKILELPSRRVLTSFSVPEGDALGSFFALDFVFSPDGTALYAVSGNHPLWRWDVATGQARRALPWIDQSLGQPDPSLTASAIGCSPEGETIAVAGGGFLGGVSTAGIYSLGTLDARTGELKWEIKGSGDWVSSVAFSPDGQTLACANGAVMLLDTRTGRLRKTLKPAIGCVMAVAFSPDGGTLAGGGSNMVSIGDFSGGGRVTLWDVPTGRIRRTLEGPTRRADTVAFAPDGRTIAAGGWGQGGERWVEHLRSRVGRAAQVRLWDVATGRLIWTAEGESLAADSLAFAPDGRSLAYCDQEYVYLVDAQTGRLKQIVMESVGRYRSREQVPRKGRGRTGAP